MSDSCSYSDGGLDKAYVQPGPPGGKHRSHIGIGNIT
jgi:hypothetical protein